MINSGKDKLTDLLGLGKDKKDSTNTATPPTNKDATKDKIKDVLGGLFGNKKKDTVKKENQ